MSAGANWIKAANKCSGSSPRRTGAQIWVTLVREEPGQEGFHIVDGELVAVDGVPLAEDCDDVPEEEEE